MNQASHLVLIGLILGMVVIRQSFLHLPQTPPRIPMTDCVPWMADCLPGVGPKRLTNAVTAVRTGQWDQLPKQAHPADWFDKP